MRDLTKSYKKIDWLRWQHRKYFIRINCAIMCAILLIILLLMFPIVSDAENTTLSDYYFIDELLDRTTAESYNGQSGYYNVNSNIFNDNWFYPDDAMNYYDSIKYVFDSNYDFSNDANYNSRKSLYFFTLKNETGLFFCFNSGCYFNGNIPANEYYNFSFPQNGSSNVYKTDGNSITVYSTLGSAESYKTLSVDKMIVATGNISGAYPISSAYEFNYLLVNNKVGNSSGGFGVTPDYPEESADNNLVFNQSDFIFTHQTYYAPYSSSINTGSAVPVGTISFKGQPNDYQLEHSSEFELQFTFSFDYNVNYKNYNSAVGYFKQTNSILGNQKNLKLNIVNNVPITVTLSTFISNKNQYSIDIKSVFDSLLIDNNTSLSGLLSQSKEITELSYNQFLITCNARLVSNGKSSGSYTENYNFNSRKGLTTDKSIEDNPNPYVPNPSDQANDDPDSTNIQPTPNVPGPGGSDDGGNSGGSTSSAQANPNIVINNNPTFNNNPSASASASSDGSGNLLSKLIDTLFGAGNVQEGSIGGHTQQQLITNTGASRWFQVANDSMSWIPASVWSELLMFLGITLGILVVAFILRIILDFL